MLGWESYARGLRLPQTYGIFTFLVEPFSSRNNLATSVLQSAILDRLDNVSAILRVSTRKWYSQTSGA
jgi:hypothetical protein